MIAKKASAYIIRNALLTLPVAVVLAGCATQSQGVPHFAFEQAQPRLSHVAKAYYDGCACGDTNRFDSHNCAHYLSNAFIQAGYTELVESPLFTVRCSEGRPVRAQELMEWFQSKSVRFHSGRVEPDTGYWASYQEKPGRRHVTLLDANTGKFYGTTECPKWPVQWNYQW